MDKDLQEEGIDFTIPGLIMFGTVIITLTVLALIVWGIFLVL